MSEARKYKSLHVAVAAMKSLPVDQQKRLILNLVQKDQHLAKSLLENLFEFDDIATLAQADFKRIWFEIPHGTWHVALRGGSDKLLMYIRSCLTKRAFDELIDELKNVGPKPRSKVIEAQQEILSEIQNLPKTERIHLPKK